jgi:hypothetical protein
MPATIGPPLAAVPATVTPVRPEPIAPLHEQPVSAPRTSVAPTAPVLPGPAPSGIQITGTPAEAVVTWWAPYSSPAPTGYVVERWKDSDPACCRATSPTLTAGEWRDPMMFSGKWRYQVTAIYADGRRGSAFNYYDYPEPVVPTGLKAEQVGKDGVTLTWQAVKGASYYAVAGTYSLWRPRSVRPYHPHVAETGTGATCACAVSPRRATRASIHEIAHPPRDGAAKPRDSLSQPGCRTENASYVLGWFEMGTRHPSAPAPTTIQRTSLARLDLDRRDGPGPDRARRPECRRPRRVELARPP